MEYILGGLHLESFLFLEVVSETDRNIGESIPELRRMDFMIPKINSSF